MIKEPTIAEVHAACAAAEARIRQYHVKSYPDTNGDILIISSTYNGVWMEHVQDAQVWAKYDGSDPAIAMRGASLFLDRALPNGQLPFRYTAVPQDTGYLYSQIQECVSFATLCVEAYEMNPTARDFLKKAYTVCCAWDNWKVTHRMQTGRGLVEMYCGYDTGHDNSLRLAGMKYPRNICADGAYMPTDCPVAPLLAVDMNANFFGDRMALAKMADILGKPEEAAAWRKKAKEIREKMMELLFDEKDCFFYDMDKHGVRRKIKSIAITQILDENVVDFDLGNEIYERHLANPREFAAPYPFPSLSLDAERTAPPLSGNDWGYYSQGNTALRTLRWMKRYGREREMHDMMRKWISAWTGEEKTPFGQELDPISGKPSDCSPWYSPTMLYYLSAARELGLV